MKITAIVFAVLYFFQGPVSAAPLRPDFYSKLDLPLYRTGFAPRAAVMTVPLYIGSDKSYAAESKGVRVAGRSLTLGLAIAALMQPLAPLVAAGFLLVGAYNAQALVSALTSNPAPRSQWTFLWSAHK